MNASFLNFTSYNFSREVLMLCPGNTSTTVFTSFSIDARERSHVFNAWMEIRHNDDFDDTSVPLTHTLGL